jgi:hypothetical protein
MIGIARSRASEECKANFMGELALLQRRFDKYRSLRDARAPDERESLGHGAALSRVQSREDVFGSCRTPSI